MRQIKFRGVDMSGARVEGLLTYKKLQSGEVMPAIMVKRSGLMRDVVPVKPYSVEQYVGTWADVEQWEQVDLEDD